MKTQFSSVSSLKETKISLLIEFSGMLTALPAGDKPVVQHNDFYYSYCKLGVEKIIKYLINRDVMGN